MTISTKFNEYYLTAYHECMHAIDAERSAYLTPKKSDRDVGIFFIHSSRILKQARKNCSLRIGSRECNDLLVSIFRYDIETKTYKIRGARGVIPFRPEHEG